MAQVERINFVNLDEYKKIRAPQGPDFLFINFLTIFEYQYCIIGWLGILFETEVDVYTLCIHKKRSEKVLC